MVATSVDLDEMAHVFGTHPVDESVKGPEEEEQKTNTNKGTGNPGFGGGVGVENECRAEPEERVNGNEGSLSKEDGSHSIGSSHDKGRAEAAADNVLGGMGKDVSSRDKEGGCGNPSHSLPNREGDGSAGETGRHGDEGVSIGVATGNGESKQKGADANGGPDTGPFKEKEDKPLAKLAPVLDVDGVALAVPAVPVGNHKDAEHEQLNDRVVVGSRTRAPEEVVHVDGEAKANEKENQVARADSGVDQRDEEDEDKVKGGRRKNGMHRGDERDLSVPILHQLGREVAAEVGLIACTVLAEGRMVNITGNFLLLANGTSVVAGASVTHTFMNGGIKGGGDMTNAGVDRGNVIVDMSSALVDFVGRNAV